MKAAQIDNYGDVSAIEVREVDKPTVDTGQVLIEVGAASLNPFDLAVLAGDAQAMAPLQFPATLGLDLVGAIVEIGDDVSDFAVGDRVYGTANAMFRASGAFAEYAAAQATSVGRAPSTATDAEAASLPTAGISALQAVQTLDIASGQKLFINGGAGGVGSLAIQIAKDRGAYVAVTASAKNSDFVTSLGADEVIDYKSQDYKELIQDYDAVLNTARTEDMDGLLGTLKQGGKAVSLTGPFDEEKAAQLGVTATAQLTHVTTEALDELRGLIDRGEVKPVIDRTVPLNNIADAYAALANESIKGKIVITLR